MPLFDSTKVRLANVDALLMRGGRLLRNHDEYYKVVNVLADQEYTAAELVRQLRTLKIDEADIPAYLVLVENEAVKNAALAYQKATNLADNAVANLVNACKRLIQRSPKPEN